MANFQWIGACLLLSLVLLWPTLAKHVHTDNSQRPYLSGPCRQGMFYKKNGHNITCIDCPTGTYMPYDNQQSSECIRVTELSTELRNHNHIEIAEPYNSTHDTSFKCANGYCECRSDGPYEGILSCRCRCPSVTQSTTDPTEASTPPTVRPDSQITGRTIAKEDHVNMTESVDEKSKTKDEQGHNTDSGTVAVVMSLVFIMLVVVEISIIIWKSRSSHPLVPSQTARGNPLDCENPYSWF